MIVDEWQLCKHSLFFLVKYMAKQNLNSLLKFFFKRTSIFYFDCFHRFPLQHLNYLTYKKALGWSVLNMYIYKLAKVGNCWTKFADIFFKGTHGLPWATLALQLVTHKKWQFCHVIILTNDNFALCNFTIWQFCYVTNLPCENFVSCQL